MNSAKVLVSGTRPCYRKRRSRARANGPDAKVTEDAGTRPLATTTYVPARHARAGAVRPPGRITGPRTFDRIFRPSHAGGQREPNDHELRDRA